MGRVIIGALVAAVAMFIIGFIFFATPLATLGMGELEDMQAAAVQQAMAANIPATGTYSVPGMGTQAQTTMFSQGPIATIHYNTDGFAATDAAALIGGLVLNFVVALLIGTGLIGIDRRVIDFPSRAKIIVYFSVAAAAFMRLGEPIYWHHDWGHFIYLFVADTAALVAGGLVIARWFLPRVKAAPESPPKDV